MFKKFFASHFFVGLLLLAGCSALPNATLFDSDDTHCSNPRFLDTENGPLWAQKLRQGRWDYFGQLKYVTPPLQSCRVKYHSSHVKNRWMVVEGIVNQGHSYPVVLDTGASQPVIFREKIVRQNGLAQYGLTDQETQLLQGWRLCNLDRLDIGRITLQDWPCFYRRGNSLLPFLQTVGRELQPVILGLPVLREFSYIIFDAANNEVEFALSASFEPAEPNSWDKYPLIIEEDLAGNVFAFVQIAIASVQTEIQLDTGSGRGLAVSQTLWEQIAQNVPNTKLTKARDYYPFMGSLPCQRAKLKNLEVGNKLLGPTQVSIFPDESPLVADYDGLIGMDCFTGQTIVLDFEQQLLWVSKTSGPNS